MSESIGVNRIKDVDSLNEFLRPFGYAYDPEQDVFYTIVDAWQRQMGYTRMYDEAAALASMILDSEPVYFEYDNKRWMIEFWKGQYCMTTGFEVGIYYTDKREKSNEYFNWTLYDCADDEHMLNMEFTLTKNGKPIIERKEKHWWLAGFKLGEFSQPWELEASISIVFKDLNMRNAFVKALQKIGYKREKLSINREIVSFVFANPKTKQPYTRTEMIEETIQRNNKLLCDTFNALSKDHDNALDKIIAIQELAPELLEKIVKMGKSKDIYLYK
ncbi:MAG: DUF4474 domain-containing protein [Tissierellia bacterium]|nr:DUF4474 domain-containing protein [Tissierellia bacterium]